MFSSIKPITDKIIPRNDYEYEFGIIKYWVKERMILLKNMTDTSIIIKPNETFCLFIEPFFYDNGYRMNVLIPIRNKSESIECLESMMNDDTSMKRIELSIFHMAICDYFIHQVLRRNNVNDNVAEYVGSYLKDSKSRIELFCKKYMFENPKIQDLYTEDETDLFFVEDATFFIEQFQKMNAKFMPTTEEGDALMAPSI